MANQYRVGIIGCGRKPVPDAQGRVRTGIAESHGRAYAAVPNATLVAAADIDPENLTSFCERHHVPHGYGDYHEMLAQEHLDIVSVCTWVSLHSRIVIDAAAARPKAILCEKPMALTIPEADAMVAACAANKVRLAINHQRRLGEPFRRAKELLTSGMIGSPLRFEAHVPGGTLLDWGTHWIDMFFYYLDQEPVEWVMAMADRHTDRVLFGEEQEDHAIVHYQFRSGVRAYLDLGVPIVRQPANRLIGTEGIIELGVSPGTPLRVHRYTSAGWEDIPVKEGIHGIEHFIHSVEALIEAVEQDAEPAHSGANGRQALEVILAAYSSVGQRGKVYLPYCAEESAMRELMALWRQQRT
ncbi:MAG: Gfo/Idh/MocA family oxidoreductase [Chloroflexi bacterium]|nr:Gfo/Idh/MocA family oxidoreductase [Chloroflexota bacterium]